MTEEGEEIFIHFAFLEVKCYARWITVYKAMYK